MSAMRSRGQRPAEADSGRGDTDATSVRKKEIVVDLERIFLREGFRRITIGELASRLHCSRRSLYNLAPSKEDLFVLVLDRLLTRIERKGREAVERGVSNHERIAGFVWPGLTETAGASPAFFADVASLSAARRRLERHQESRRRQLRALIEAGVRAGECRRVHPEVGAHMMLAAYRSVTDPAFLVTVGVSTTEAIREAHELLLYGLLGRGVRVGARSARVRTGARALRVRTGARRS